jgi:hypothetical protein
LNNKIGTGYNLDLYSQIDIFCRIIMENKILNEVFTRAPSLGLKNYYIGAGCLAQTIWNYLSGFPLNQGIQDIDFVYFNDKDVSFDEEDDVVNKVHKLYKDIPIKIDVKNQARVHLWYERHFGYAIKPYPSLEAAINTWPTTATALGARRDSKGRWIVYAPFGLNDLFGKIVRANKTQITKEIYEKKVIKWSAIWTDLKIIPWEE